MFLLLHVDFYICVMEACLQQEQQQYISNTWQMICTLQKLGCRFLTCISCHHMHVINMQP